MRDSGSIEQIADKVWLLYRPEYYMIEELDDDDFTSTDCILMLIVAKNKNGKIDSEDFEIIIIDNCEYLIFTESFNSTNRILVLRRSVLKFYLQFNDQLVFRV